MNRDIQAQIYLADTAFKDLEKLYKDDGAFKSKFASFEQKFRRNPANPGLHVEPLNAGKQELRSARIDRQYRAIFLPPVEESWTLVRVGNHDEVYKAIERTRFTYSQTDGRIEYAMVTEAHADPREPLRDAPGPALDGPFKAWTDTELVELGVNRTFLPSIRGIRTETEAEEFIEHAAGMTRKALEALLSGWSFDEVLEYVTEPSGSHPVADFDEALARSMDTMTSSDAAVEALLAEDWSKWRLFLHPDQKRAATKDYNGPARISGGPGTGKTVVLVHRARELARRPDRTGPILISTFNKALASDIEQKVASLAGRELASHITVRHVDALAADLVKTSGGDNHQRATASEVAAFWEQARREAGEPGEGFDAAFLDEEYNEVVLASGVTERRAYLQAPRRGRRRRLSRAERMTVWDLTRRFEALLERAGKTTWGKLAGEAAAYAETQARGGNQAWAHILVDEAQDLNPQHWRMLRHLVAEGRNDLFIAADSHQRLYRKPIALAPLGINIRGRSARLHVNYRTGHLILKRTFGILGGDRYEDFDQDFDTLAGYRSVLRGGTVDIEGFNRSSDEIDAMVDTVRAWKKQAPGASIGVAAPDNHRVEEARRALDLAGLAVARVGASAADEAIRVDTMFQMKGLEFQRVACTGLGAAQFPPKHLRPAAGDDAAALSYKRQQAQSLLFVTATRARDQVALFHTGTPCEPLARILDGTEQ